MISVGIVGSGAMGSGIAQVAATAGHSVLIYDNNPDALKRSRNKLAKIMDRLVEKEKISQAESASIQQRIQYVDSLYKMAEVGLVVEAIVERIEVKKALFEQLEDVLSENAILATNTSSLAVTAIAAACQKPGRVLGLHFFNPAPLMALVEVVPAVQTDAKIAEECFELMKKWGKVPVMAKDTPGFIVNRVARPFYSEALRVYEEGIADLATIDWVMTELGGFRMGPFTLMDYIGHDVNYKVTETVFAAFYFDPRYKPSFTQQRLVDAGYLGRKSGRGFYNYEEGSVQPEPTRDAAKGKAILHRILVMLINEAADALYLNVASRDAIDLAMTKGVNYPKGLLAWADELTIPYVVEKLDALYAEYHEDRYRCSPLLRRLAREGKPFYPNS
ncbi:MAG: 3-hydroxyacyl-CoA dehydrogenase NAD-binding domain-containing protein [Lewinella sp.]|uniref:3-hydroxyacyl-CoA dehydrogenase NAD-binding domain-containing protein n=1 Tax=Lewinella sp. TaxID=2004506 RepID=UPI003D6BB099